MSYESFVAAIDALREAKELLGENSIPKDPRVRFRENTIRNGISRSGQDVATPHTSASTRSDRSEGSVARKLEALSFQKEIDDVTRNMDTKLRGVTALQGMDLDKEFGIARKNQKSDLSPSMRLVEERSMRSEALVIYLFL